MLTSKVDKKKSIKSGQTKDVQTQTQDSYIQQANPVNIHPFDNSQSGYQQNQHLVTQSNFANMHQYPKANQQDNFNVNNTKISQQRNNYSYIPIHNK